MNENIRYITLTFVELIVSDTIPIDYDVLRIVSVVPLSEHIQEFNEPIADGVDRLLAGKAGGYVSTILSENGKI